MAYDNTMKIEFYKPKYNLDIKFDGDDSFDLLFKNVSGEFFFSADVESYDAYVSFEDEECEFTNGELIAKVDISDLMETIANGQLRNTNGTTYGEWIPRIVGDYKTEHDLVFDGKTYADRGYWELFFKEMSKDEIKDFIEFCRDYIDIPNLEFSSRNFNFDDKGYIIISDDNYSNAHTYSLTINDDLTIEMAHKFICKSLDAIGVWESNHDYGDEFEEKKSIKKSLKEEKVTDSLFSDVVFSMIKKFKLKKEYDVERPSWYVFNFRHKNKDAQFGITFDKYNNDSLYGDVLAFGDEKDDIFKYKTDEVKVDSYNIEKECLNIIADCLAFIDTNKKITIFESKKSTRKSLKESVEFDYDNHSGVFFAYVDGSDLSIAYAPRKYEDLSGWDISKDGKLLAYDCWEDKSDEYVLNSIKEFEKQLKKYFDIADVKIIMKDFNEKVGKYI